MLDVDSSLGCGLLVVSIPFYYFVIWFCLQLAVTQLHIELGTIKNPENNCQVFYDVADNPGLCGWSFCGENGFVSQ
jgi:hypothetical protein